MMNADQAKPTRILVVDDESSARSALSELLREEGYEVQSAADGYKALGRVDQWEPDVVITDVKMPALGGIELMTKLREQYPDVAVIVMTAFGSVEGAVEAIQLGADDYLSKPVHLPQLLMVLRRVLKHRALQREARRLRSALEGQKPTDVRANVVGQAKAFRDLLDLAHQVADSPVSVLITGEGGTGKQYLARLIHQWSGRTGPFVTVKCSAFSEAAFERELFGVREGDSVLREGLLLQANGGTLLLTDIDELPLAVQARLLRFLQEKSFTRVGDTGGYLTRLRTELRADQLRDLKLRRESGPVVSNYHNVVFDDRPSSSSCAVDRSGQLAQLLLLVPVLAWIRPRRRRTT